MESDRSLRCTSGVVVIALFSSALLAAAPLDLKELDAGLFERLRAKSSEHVDVTLDGSVLKMAGSFLASDGDEDSAKIKKLVDGLKSVTVRSFTFKQPGDYTPADVDAVRSQIKASQWTRIVDAHSKEDGGSAEIYILPGKDKPQGLFIIATNLKSLTLVHIVGAVDLNDLGALEDLGVPDVGQRHNGKGEK